MAELAPKHREPAPMRAAQSAEEQDFAIVSLPRTGAPPMRFRGRLLHGASNEDLDGAAFSELRVYARGKGGFVAAVNVRRSALMIEDIHIAQICATLEDALDVIERVDPTCGWSEPAVLAARQGAARLLGVVALRLKLERLREEHLRLVERSVTLWGATPSPTAAPLALAAPPVAAAFLDCEATAARIAIRPPRG